MHALNLFSYCRCHSVQDMNNLSVVPPLKASQWTWLPFERSVACVEYISLYLVDSTEPFYYSTLIIGHIWYSIFRCRFSWIFCSVWLDNIAVQTLLLNAVLLCLGVIINGTSESACYGLFVGISTAIVASTSCICEKNTLTFTITV